MTLPTRKQVPVRLPPDQIVRLERAAHARGQTQQTFQQIAIVRAIEEAEAETEISRDRKQRKGAERAGRNDAEPAGLGLGEFRPIREQKTRPDESVPTVSNPVSVYVGTSANSGSEDAVSRLVAYIVSGPDAERDRRTRVAVEVIRSSSKSEDERTELAKKLDAAVEAHDKKSPGDGSLSRLAGLAFDRIKEWLPSSS